MTNAEAVLHAVETVGPMSAREIGHLLGRSRASVANSIRDLRANGLIHISAYERQPDGQGGRFILIMAPGNHPDAKYPKRRSKKETDKRYRERHAAAISARRYGDHRGLGVWSGLLK